MINKQGKIGIIGGTGFYDFFEQGFKEVEVNTEYGLSSDKIIISSLFGKEVVFLPRHGKKHQLPPHKIPYKANIAAMRSLGVDRIIAPTAVGSLQKSIEPGDFVICDQFIDQTKNREDTFFNGPQVAHIEMAYPYCPELRKLAFNKAEGLGLRTHAKGTVVVIEGPRFSTLADSLRFSRMGADLINMTQYPEVVLASELGICYLNISLVTDYDAGIYAGKEAEPVSIEQVLANFKKNNDKLKNLILEVIKEMPDKSSCDCEEKAKRAMLS